MKPTHPKVTWMVYMTNELGPNAALARTPSWAWVAHGPRGSDAGVEHTADDACTKAYAAAMLLSEPKAQR